MPRPGRRTRDADTVLLERELSASLGLRHHPQAEDARRRAAPHYASLDQLRRMLSLLRARSRSWPVLVNFRG